jgi:hypothetical protein
LICAGRFLLVAPTSDFVANGKRKTLRKLGIESIVKEEQRVEEEGEGEDEDEGQDVEQCLSNGPTCVESDGESPEKLPVPDSPRRLA